MGVVRREAGQQAEAKVGVRLRHPPDVRVGLDDGEGLGVGSGGKRRQGVGQAAERHKDKGDEDYAEGEPGGGAGKTWHEGTSVVCLLL